MGRLNILILIALLIVFCNAECTRPSPAGCIDAAPRPKPPLKRQGYTRQPDTRGTLDIVWSCVFTTFLCTWTIICVNLPDPDAPYYMMWWRRLWMTAIGLLAPEIMFGFAMVHFCSAMRSAEAFDNSGYKDWTLTHSFYADAGGFILHTPDFPPFPVNGLQLHYLVTNNFIPMPKLSKKHIADRNKVDGMLRLISLWQILWFCMNEFFRYLDGLHIAALELTTVANIVVTMPSTFCWFFKPQDITIPEVIFCSTPISTIVLSAAVRPGAHYRYTPLDFVDRKEWTWSKQWTHYMNLPRHILRPLKWDPFTLPTPRPRIQTTHVPALSGRAYTILSLITLAYMSMFVLAWNHEFPSSDELLLWRLCSLGALVLGVLCLFFEHLGWIWWPYIQQRLMSHARYRAIRQRIIWQPRWGWERRLQSWVQSWTKAMRNNTIDQDPEMDIPLLTQIPLYLIGGTYCVTRAIMVGLDVAELRWMPISAYDEAKWSNLLPHV